MLASPRYNGRSEDKNKAAIHLFINSYTRQSELCHLFKGCKQKIRLSHINYYSFHLTYMYGKFINDLQGSPLRHALQLLF